MSECPCCKRKFENITDYPYFELKSVVSLPLPKYVIGKDLFGEHIEKYLLSQVLSYEDIKKHPKMGKNSIEDEKYVLCAGDKCFTKIKDNYWIIYQNDIKQWEKYVNDNKKEIDSHIEKICKETTERETKDLKSLINKQYYITKDEVFMEWSLKNIENNKFTYVLKLCETTGRIGLQQMYKQILDIAQIEFVGMLQIS